MNLTKLLQEIKAGGFDAVSVDENMIVIDSQGDEIQNLPEVIAIITAHDPTDYVSLRKEVAQEAIKVIPEWAMITQAEIDVWHQTKITNELVLVTALNLASLVVLKGVVTTLGMVVWKLAKVVIYLRDIVIDTRGQIQD